jgi:hypothetical protein
MPHLSRLLWDREHGITQAHISKYTNKPPEFTKKTKNYSLKKNFAEKSFKDVSKGRSGRFFDCSSCCDTALYW